MRKVDIFIEHLSAAATRRCCDIYFHIPLEFVYAVLILDDDMRTVQSCSYIDDRGLPLLQNRRAVLCEGET